jgi:hypothetical protein
MWRRKILTHRRVWPYACQPQNPASCNRKSHCCKRLAERSGSLCLFRSSQVGQIYEIGHNPFSTLRRQVVIKRRAPHLGLSFPLPMTRLHWSKKERSESADR